MEPAPRFWTTLEERDALLAGPTSVPPARPEAVAADAHEDAHDDGDERFRLSRRAFLATSGFTVAGALAACGRAPTQFVAPGSTTPEDVVPGRSAWYSTTCGACPAGCGLRVRSVDGRPVKVEGNPDHPVSKGGVCAAGQASLLSLYDSKRLLAPRVDGSRASWSATDARIAVDLEKARASGKSVAFVSSTVASPSTEEAIGEFLESFPAARRVVVDPLSSSAVLAAHERTHGVRAMPRLRLERAEEILGIDADFLATWVSPVEHTRGWRDGRVASGSPPRTSRHVQVESALSLTGGAADERIRVEPGVVGAFVAHLAHRLASRAQIPCPAPSGAPPVPAAVLDRAAERLFARRGKAVVVCGTNDVDVQRLVAVANEALGAYGAVLDLAAPSRQRAGDDAAYEAFLADLEAGTFAAVFVAGVDPVVDLPGGARFRAAYAKAPLRVAWAERDDETTALSTVVLPAPHAFEAWDDVEAVAGVVSTRQPLIGAFGEPRSLRECVAAFLGRPRADLDLLKDAWAKLHHPRQSRSATAESSFRRAVHDGFAEAAVPPAAATFDARGAADAAPRTTSPGAGRMALVLFPTVSMRDGRHAENPWLHELPDPLTKQVWGNVACLSPKAAEALGVEDGDVVRVSAPGGPSIELPALRQPGLADRTVAVALGYGRRGSERFADLGPEWIGKAPTVAAGKRVGTDASPFLSVRGGAASYAGAEVTVARTGAREDLALSQTWSTLDVPKRLAPHGGERRDAVRETTVAALAADPRAGNPKPHGGADLWPDEPKAPGPRWRMAIDLSACTGCSACVVACQAENNVPVVGKDEVRRRRDLHWMRIDRYYADAADGDVDVVHQPMLCHHCGNAPCETVCPVLATVHSSDGLNAQVYNRCVGTRYCANNCPYKVRRFNWFSYDREDPWADLALNPDVAVRSRGVMEKCSFCVQRLQEAGAAARRAGRPMADGEAKTACQQSCPAQAIVFGDANDPKSRIAAVAADPRHYRVLQELNVDPSVGYLVRVRNREGVSKGASHD